MTIEIMSYQKDQTDAESIELIKIDSDYSMDKALMKIKKLLIGYKTKQVTVIKHE